MYRFDHLDFDRISEEFQGQFLFDISVTYMRTASLYGQLRMFRAIQIKGPATEQVLAECRTTYIHTRVPSIPALKDSNRQPQDSQQTRLARSKVQRSSVSLRNCFHN